METQPKIKVPRPQWGVIYKGVLLPKQYWDARQATKSVLRQCEGGNDKDWWIITPQGVKLSLEIMIQA